MRIFRPLSLLAALLLAPLPALAQLPPGGALIVNQTPIQGGSNGQCLYINSSVLGAQSCGSSGTVTSVSVTTANGVSGSVATATTTPAITLTLGAITPTSVNGNTLTTGTGTLTLGSVTLNAGAGGTLGSNAFTSTAYAPIASPTFTGTVTIPNGGVFGTPTSLTLTNATGLPLSTGVTGTLAAAQFPALTGDVTTVAGALATTLATVASAGTTGSSTAIPVITINAKGLTTTITTAAVVAPAGTLTGATLAAGVTASSLTSLGTITTLTATTINAFALAGTISGGGNNLNNIVIGSTTPLAGTFTTATANTSVTSPIHAGGSAASSTLTLESTSGAGTTDAIILATASQVERARITTGGLFNLGPNVAPDVLFTINANTVATTATASPYNVHIIGANSANPGILSDAFTGQNLYTARLALGTAAAPTQVTGSSIMLGFTGQALDDTGTYRSASTLELVTLGAVTSSSAGGYVRIRTITTGTVSLTEKLRVGSGLSIGDSTDPGIGGLRATGATVQLTGLGTDAAQVDATVCRVAASGLLVTGTGALGICLGTSGAQFKTELVPMQAGLAELMRIDFQNYRYRPGFGDGGAAMQYGTTAQNVEGALPDLVRYAHSGEALNFDSGALMFIGLHAVQQLKVSADRLEARLARLEAK